MERHRWRKEIGLNEVNPREITFSAGACGISGDRMEPAQIDGATINIKVNILTDIFGAVLDDDRLDTPVKIYEHYKKLYPDYFLGPASGALLLNNTDIIFQHM